MNSITASVNVFFGNPEYKYSEAELAEYTLMMKRAFKNGTYFINCDYGSAGIQVGDYHKKIGFDHISDKLIALVIYHSRLKSANSRYKFGYYAYKVSDLNDVYDAIMTSYPYHNTYRQETTYESCNSIENRLIAS